MNFGRCLSPAFPGPCPQIPEADLLPGRSLGVLFHCTAGGNRGPERGGPCSWELFLKNVLAPPVTDQGAVPSHTATALTAPPGLSSSSPDRPAPTRVFYRDLTPQGPGQALSPRPGFRQQRRQAGGRPPLRPRQVFALQPPDRTDTRPLLELPRPRALTLWDEWGGSADSMIQSVRPQPLELSAFHCVALERLLNFSEPPSTQTVLSPSCWS